MHLGRIGEKRRAEAGVPSRPQRGELSELRSVSTLRSEFLPDARHFSPILP